MARLELLAVLVLVVTHQAQAGCGVASVEGGEAGTTLLSKSDGAPAAAPTLSGGDGHDAGVGDDMGRDTDRDTLEVYEALPPMSEGSGEGREGGATPQVEAETKPALLGSRNERVFVTKLRAQYDHMAGLMRIISPEDIKREVEAAARKHQLPNVSQFAGVVQQASVWGDVRAMNPVFKWASENMVVFFNTGKTASLADVMAYFARKLIRSAHREAIFSDGVPGDFNVQSVKQVLAQTPAGEERVLLLMLDPVMMDLVRSDEQLRADLKRMLLIDCKALGRSSGCVRLAALEGWAGGITMFNQPLYAKKIDALAMTYAQYLEEHDAETAGRACLQGPVLDFVKEVFEGTGLRPVVEFIKLPSMLNSEDPYGATSASLRPKLPTFDEYLSAVDRAVGSCPDVDSFPEIMEKDGRMYSFHQLANLSRKIFKKLMRSTSNIRRASQKELYLLIPHVGKSYVVATHLFLTINEFRADRVVMMNFSSAGHYDDDDAIRELGGVIKGINAAAESVFVVLDDYAGSGESLENVVEKFRRVSSNRIVVAPLLQSSIATRRFSDVYVDSLYGEQVPCFAQELGKPALWMGDPGYSTSHRYAFVFVTKPYASPDNNAAVFSQHLAALFVAAQRGVKRLEGQGGVLCTPRSRMKALFDIDVPRETSNAPAPNGSCSGFIFQYYCKVMEPFIKMDDACPRGPNLRDMITDVSQPDSKWVGELPSPLPTGECLERALAQTNFNGHLEVGEDGGFRIPDNDCENLCEIIYHPMAQGPLVSTGESHVEAMRRETIVRLANDGVYGWVMPESAERRRGEYACAMDPRLCNVNLLFNEVKREFIHRGWFSYAHKYDISAEEAECIMMSLRFACEGGFQGRSKGRVVTFPPRAEAFYQEALGAGEWDESVRKVDRDRLAKPSCIEMGLSSLIHFSTGATHAAVRRGEAIQISKKMINSVCGTCDQIGIPGTPVAICKLDLVDPAIAPWWTGWTGAYG